MLTVEPALPSSEGIAMRDFDESVPKDCSSDRTDLSRVVRPPCLRRHRYKYKHEFRVSTPTMPPTVLPMSVLWLTRVAGYIVTVLVGVVETDVKTNGDWTIVETDEALEDIGNEDESVETLVIRFS